MSESVLQQLMERIAARRREMPEGSYTAQLFAAGEQEIAKKVGEEGVEVVVAALAQDDARLLSESADLIYHLLVLLAQRGLAWAQVEEELARRFR
ncbi:MAG: phosphoribosyl-ATP diphosphatase [Caldilineales bacterium]|nr:phosphoribosyl-ATP diphosphatase [Caldilineales bacterium]